MKKILSFLLGLLCISSVYSQSVTKGNILINTGVGFGIYKAKTSIDSAGTSSAVPGLLNISAGYAITDDFSAGVRLERNGFVSAKEDSNKVTSINPAIFATYNFVNSDKTVLFFTAEYGLSTLMFVSERPNDIKNNVSVKSKSGSKINFDLGLSKYFSDNVGMFFNFGYAFYTYNKLNYHNDSNDPSDWIWTEDGAINGTPIKFKMNGVNIRTGLALKF